MARNVLDLSKLPPPAAVETLSFADIVADIKADLIERAPATAAVLDLESEPMVKLLEAFAYRELMLRNRINKVALADTLAYSFGADLDVAAANLGVARLEGEEDEAFRARAVMAPESWSVAGPEEGYIFNARSADPAVADVAVSSPVPGLVRVVVLSHAVDGVADAGLLATVASALNKETVRPLAEEVEVVSAGVAAWNVVATLKILPGPEQTTVEEAAVAAVRRYAAARRKLNKGVKHKALIAALMQEGVEDVELISPADDVPAAADTAPVLGDLILTIEVVG
jgi:phage-related baseplate assembly protein